MRTCIDGFPRFVLRLPRTVDVLPKDLKMWSVAVILVCTIWPHLLVIHTWRFQRPEISSSLGKIKIPGKWHGKILSLEDRGTQRMSNLVDDVSFVVQCIAPSQVDVARMGRPSKGGTAAAALLLHRDVRIPQTRNKTRKTSKQKQPKKNNKRFFNFKSWIPCVRVLDQGDARMAPPLGCSRIESLPHRWSGSLRVMLVPHNHILSPFWCHSFWSHGGSFNPRTSVLTSITIIA